MNYTKNDHPTQHIMALNVDSHRNDSKLKFKLLQKFIKKLLILMRCFDDYDEDIKSLMRSCSCFSAFALGRE